VYCFGFVDMGQQVLEGIRTVVRQEEALRVLVDIWPDGNKTVRRKGEASKVIDNVHGTLVCAHTDTRL
jgi:hypothetical protein